MNKVLIGTDFSQVAENACRYAASMCRHFHAKLIICCAYEEVPIPLGSLEEVKTLDSMKGYTADLLDAFAESINSIYDIAVVTHNVKGTIAHVVEKIAEWERPDIIVIGHSKHRGSVLNGLPHQLIKKTFLPLLLVPDFATFQGVEGVAVYRHRAYDEMQERLFALFGASLRVVDATEQNIASVIQEKQIHLFVMQFDGHQRRIIKQLIQPVFYERLVPLLVLPWATNMKRL